MIPYFRPPPIDLGFTKIEPFGILTAVGLLVGTYLIAVAAKRDGKDPQPVQDFVLFGLLGGVIVGHLMHVLLYHPEELDRSPWQIFKVWDGLSSTGGMLGGALAVWLFFKVTKRNLREYLDPIMLGIVPGWAIARIGCFTVHDHPGRLTDFFLAVDFPPGSLPGGAGGTRFDLGLIEAIALLGITALLWTLRKKEILRGYYLPLTLLIYGVIRFFEDFLRATDLAYVDKRYFGLTPAQYVAIGFVIYGATVFIRRGMGKRSPGTA